MAHVHVEIEDYQVAIRILNGRRAPDDVRRVESPQHDARSSGNGRGGSKPHSRASAKSSAEADPPNLIGFQGTYQSSSSSTSITSASRSKGGTSWKMPGATWTFQATAAIQQSPATHRWRRSARQSACLRHREMHHRRDTPAAGNPCRGRRPALPARQPPPAQRAGHSDEGGDRLRGVGDDGVRFSVLAPAVRGPSAAQFISTRSGWFSAWIVS